MESSQTDRQAKVAGGRAPAGSLRGVWEVTAAPLGSGRGQPRASAMQIDDLITQRGAQQIIQVRRARPGSGSQGDGPEEAAAQGFEGKGSIGRHR